MNRVTHSEINWPVSIIGDNIMWSYELLVNTVAAFILIHIVYFFLLQSYHPDVSRSGTAN